MTEHQSDNRRIAEIEAAFPSWSVWISDTGNWWASLRSALTLDQMTAGCTPFVRADDPGELVRLLAAREDPDEPGCVVTSADEVRPIGDFPAGLVGPRRGR